MEIGKEKRYLEKVEHVTRTSPYSLHKSMYKCGSEPALYLHLHPEMEFFYLEEGELNFEVEDKCYYMQAGDGIFLPQNLLHTAKAVSDKGVFRAFCFAPEYLASSMEKYHFQKYVQPVLHSSISYLLLLKQTVGWQREILDLLKNIFEQSEKEDKPDLLIRGYLLLIWQHLYEYHIKNQLKSEEKSRQEKRIEEVISYIHAHFEEELTLKMLTDVVHLSEGQLCRSFKEIMGTTPFGYLKRYRILQSSILLERTDKKISEICLLCGFSNISYYNREFLKIMKTTPSKYRMEADKYGAQGLEEGENLRL